MSQDQVLHDLFVDSINHDDAATVRKLLSEGFSVKDDYMMLINAATMHRGNDEILRMLILGGANLEDIDKIRTLTLDQQTLFGTSREEKLIQSVKQQLEAEQASEEAAYSALELIQTETKFITKRAI